MQTDPRGAAALGAPGGGIAYGGTNKITPSVVIEMDTFKDGYDPDDNHIAVMLDGNETNHLAVYTPPFVMRDVQFDVWVDYTAAVTKLDVYVSRGFGSAKPKLPQLSYNIDLAHYFNGQAFYLGITGSAGDGDAQQEHHVVGFAASDSVLTSQLCCATDSDCSSSPLGGRCDSIKHVCGQCTINSSDQCPTGQPGCDLGPTSNTCIPQCTGDFGSGMAGACPTASAAVCVTSGPHTGSCISCNGNNGSGVSHACPAEEPSCSTYLGFC